MRRTLENALDKAIESFDMDAKDRLCFRLRLAFFPEAHRAVLAFLKEKAVEEAGPLAAANFDFPAIDIDEFEKWIALIIKYLPMIIAIFM